jgi:hypothetical protein
MCGVRPANIQHSYHNHPTPLKSGFAISYNNFFFGYKEGIKPGKEKDYNATIRGTNIPNISAVTK